MTVPTTITSKLDELEQLCEKYPSKIPVRECAAFLGLEDESLRHCLEHGNCPFGLGWIKKMHFSLLCVRSIWARV